MILRFLVYFGLLIFSSGVSAGECRAVEQCQSGGCRYVTVCGNEPEVFDPQIKRKVEELERERQRLAEERRRFEDEKSQSNAQNTLENIRDNNSVITKDNRRRFALVIGNAAYKNSPLRNPVNDANLISSVLSSSGFAVSRYENLTYNKMREVVRDFGAKLNRGDVGLFYYSGHAHGV